MNTVNESNSNNFCGDIKAPSDWKVFAAKQVIPEASWIWDNFENFVRLLCSKEEATTVKVLNSLIKSARSAGNLCNELSKGFNLFIKYSDNPPPVGEDVFESIINTIKDNTRFNNQKVFVLCKSLLNSGATDKQVNELISYVDMMSAKMNLNIDISELQNSLFALNESVIKIKESDIRSTIRSFLLKEFFNFGNKEEQETVFLLPGDSNYEYKKDGDNWLARKKGTKDFKIKVNSKSAIDKLNKKAKPVKGVDNKNNKNNKKNSKKSSDKTTYGIEEFIKVGKKEYIVLPDGIVWQSGGYNKKAPGGKADRSEVIEIGHINDENLKSIKQGLLDSGYVEPKKYKKVEKDNINSIGRWFSMVFTSPLPLYARAFAAYLMGRKKTWTEKGLTLKQYNALKNLVIYALTPQGRYIANNAARLGVDNKGGLLSYGIYRLANDIHGYDSTGIFTGDSAKGFDAGAGEGPYNSLSKFVGGMNPESRGKIKEYASKVASDEGFVMVLNDMYDFDEYESKRRIFEKNPNVWETVYKPAFKKAKSGGSYEGIRYAAGFKMAIKDKKGKYYEGYPIKITLKITSADIKRAKKALERHLGSVDNPEYYKDKKMLGLIKDKREKEKNNIKKDSLPSSETSSSLPNPKKLSWINVTSVTDKEIKGVLSNGKNVVYKSGTMPYKNTIQDLKK